MSENAAPRLPQWPWWDIMFIVVPAVAVAATLLFTLDADAIERTRAFVATALVALILVIWFVIARRHVGPTATGYWSLAVIVALMIAAMTLVPVLGIIQGLLFPYLWVTLGPTIPRGIIWSIVIAVVIGVARLAFHGTDELVQTLFTQAMSAMLSIGIGVAITFAWSVADQRQALLDELNSTQEQVRDLSRQAGISLERERLSRELHDTLAQTLAGLSLLSERAARGARRAAVSGNSSSPLEPPRASDAHDSAPAETGARVETVAAQLDQIADLAKTAHAEARALIAESASVHDDSGTTFAEAVDRLAERFRRETDIEVEVHRRVSGRGDAVPRDHQVVLLRCLQEGLSNVRRHARATRAEVRLGVHAQPREIVLKITDNGTGFDGDANPSSGFGIPGMRERARLLDGTVDIDTAPGSGSAITVRLPLLESRSPESAGGAAAGNRTIEETT